MFRDATIEEINQYMEAAFNAFMVYRKVSLKQRADLMRAIAAEIENLGDTLLQTAGKETNLPEARLRNERGRTIFQLQSYADACERGDWLEASIDTADLNRNPPKPDIRKMLVPLGPVVVFGAANFPFAYSTAGGDTASALAAGCPVIVKAHPAHPATSEMVASAISKAVTSCKLPASVFTHLHGASVEVGQALVKHPRTAAVGFTGSLAGGKALYDLAVNRPVPIPVFAEMSSINPVFLLPGKIKTNAAETAKLYAGSITLGAGQFCTNPGLIIAIDDEHTKKFLEVLADEIRESVPAKMLHAGIYRNYVSKQEQLLLQKGVQELSRSTFTAADMQGTPAIAVSDAATFISNPVLHQEVFGPLSLVILCKDIAEMEKVSEKAEGQLTVTVMATENDILNNPSLINKLSLVCGRFILNSVPTGVEVCLSMQHGGPYPATTDSRFTAVGAGAIKRFARPQSFQNWPDALLPEELKNANPAGVPRTVNNNWTKNPL
ncbi:MAG: aldehyde dehydrogenase (NADP(+)) [Chitinophagaceae bacterium]|nr:aldehyde dehydrogenase (NADP(+)) [Chitinophagaceae bacterium]